MKGPLNQSYWFKGPFTGSVTGYSTVMVLVSMNR